MVGEQAELGPQPSLHIACAILSGVANSIYLVGLDALADTWRQWAEVGEGLQPEDWAASSRCEGWDVACLYAHHSLFPVALSHPLSPAHDSTSRAVLTAAAILRRFNVEKGAAHTMAGSVALRAREDARQLTAEDLVRRFSSLGNQAVSALRSTSPDFLIGWPRTDGLVPLREGLRIVLLESTVHLLDVLRALKREPAVSSDALRETATLLAEVAPPLEFVEAATGRHTTSPLPVLR